jgi:predicted peptidase
VALQAFKQTIYEYNVDQTRLYLTGLSMGGFATWGYGAAEPDLFAALMPICGGGDPEDAAALARTPIWAFHGADDKVVPPERSREMVEAVMAAGGDVRYTEFVETGHNSWDAAYGDRKHIRWLLNQSRPAEAAAPPKAEEDSEGATR